MSSNRSSLAGTVALTGRSEIVWVKGPDTITFLDGLLSQNIADLKMGETTRSLLLAPNGKLRATLFVLRGEDSVGLVCDAGRADVVVADLSRFKIRVDVAIDVDVRPLFEIWGMTASDVVSDVPGDGRWSGSQDRLVLPMPFQRSDVPRVLTHEIPDGIPQVDPGWVEAFRIEIGEPVMGVDLNEKTIPQEGLDVSRYVDFDKGCYLGQELVARIDSRGHVNRRLSGLVVAERVDLPMGTPVVVGERAVGEVTSSVWSTPGQRVVALAMLRVEVAAGTSVLAGPAEGTVVSLPMTV